MNYVIIPNDPWAKIIFYDIIGRKTKAGEHFLLYRDWLQQVVKITKFAIFAEAATGGVLWKKVFLKILQNSQENTCVGVSFLIKLQGWGPQLY